MKNLFNNKFYLILRQTFLIVLILILVIQLNTFSNRSGINNPEVKAYSNSKLIDDAVFDNYNSMTSNQIQDLLIRENSCLKSKVVLDYSYGSGGWSYQGEILVSGLIYKVAQEWNINPQVILATLQKEQSLLTLSDCPEWKYNSAMGYGCPDSGGCLAKYADITKQILWGSWQLKFNKERSVGNTGWNGDSGIYYVGYMTSGYRSRCATCSSYYYDGYATIDNTLINFENGSTASLYTYTPHLGQSFPRIFESYFGSTSSDGTINSALVKSSSNATVYLEDNNILYPFITLDNYIAWDKRDKPIRTVSDSYITSRAQGQALRRLVKFADDVNVYLIDNGTLYNYISPEQLYSWGFSFGDVQYLPNTLKNNFIGSQNLSTIIAEHNNPKLYLVQNGQKYNILDLKTYTTQGNPIYSSRGITRLAKSLMDILPESYNPIIANGNIIKDSDSPAIYLYDSGNLYWFSYSAWQNWGTPLDATYDVERLGLNKIEHVPELIKANDNSGYFIIDQGQKLHINQVSLESYNLTKFESLSLDSLRRFTGVNVDKVFRSSEKGYVMQNGGLKHIITWNDFLRYGLDWNSLRNISNTTITNLQ